MANVLDYIKWRGDLSLKQDGFNVIDNLILARFAYFPFDEIIGENEVVTIEELSKRFQKLEITALPILWKDDPDLFVAMGNSKRFGEMKATKYINKIDTEEEKQFSAITVLMPNDLIYVAYRGTDNTIVGWKEDFNMGFKSHIASQKDAALYLEEVASMYSGNLILGGHSKGGNLAAYAAIFTTDKIKSRIISVYNNDGPGFIKSIIEDERYKNVVDKIHTIIPQSSVIGRLLYHEEEYIIVESTERALMQHDLYSWQLEGKDFVVLEKLTNGSEIVDKTITEWFESVDSKQRELIIDIVFEILGSTDAKTMAQLRDNWFENAKIIYRKYKDVDDETKEMIGQTLNALFRIAKDNIFKMAPKVPGLNKSEEKE